MPAAIASPGLWPESSRPLKMIPPPSGGIIPNRIFINVLLPEPFSPRRPTIWPRMTSRLMPALARTPPNDLTMSRISRSGFGRDTTRRPQSRTRRLCSLAAARVLARRRKLELAGGKLLLIVRELRDHRRRHRRIERAVGQLLERGACRFRRVV